MDNWQPPLPPPSRRNLSNSLFEFSAAIAQLPPEEITKAKLLYIENALSDCLATVEAIHLLRKASVAIIIVTIVVLLLDSFAFIFPLWVAICSIVWQTIAKTNLKKNRRKIDNAIEIWRDDLGNDYNRLVDKLNHIKA